MSGDQLKIIFNGQTEELLKIYNSGESIVRFLNGKSKYNDVVCNMLNTGVINIKEFLNEGAMGRIYAIELPFGDSKEYVMKQKTDQDDEEPYRCLVEKPYKFIDNITMRYEEIPTNNYICQDEQYSEYMIGVLVSQLYKNGLTPRGNSLYNINFLDMLSFTTCHEPNYSQYIFMERITTDLDSKVLNNFNLASITYQLIIAILFYQSIFKISHNDLHQKNIFLEKITNKTKYNGKYLKDYRYISYNIYGKEYYVPLGKYLVKIGDWGLSCKYSKPMVLSRYVIDNELATDDYHENGKLVEFKPVIPNMYCPSYDLVFSLTTIYLKVKNSEAHKPIISLINKFIKYITGSNLIHYITSISLNYNRPNLSELKKYKTAQNIFSEDVLLKDLKDKPDMEWLRVGQLL